jgi:hypothetical protein
MQTSRVNGLLIVRPVTETFAAVSTTESQSNATVFVFLLLFLFESVLWR